MNNPEVTQMALSILRKGDNFQWYVITLLALVVDVYTNEAAKKKVDLGARLLHSLLPDRHTISSRSLRI